MKKINLLATVIVIGLILNSCSNNKAEKKTETTESEQKTDLDESVPSEVESVPSEIEITKKDTAKLENFIFMVKNIIDPATPSNVRLDDNQKYIAVQIWFKNTTNADVTLKNSDFKLIDHEDAEFIEEQNMFGRKKPTLFSEDSDTRGELTLKPNEAKSGWATFAVSGTSKAAKIKYENITVKL